MSTQVQYRRGTGSQNNAFTGALGEITVDTTNWTLRVHDGVTAGGGGNLATVAYVDAEIGGLSADSISNGTSNVKVISSGGNVNVTVGGSIIQTVASTGIFVTGLVSATGNVIAGNVTTAGLLSVNSGNVSGTVIVNAGGNGVGNIGSATGYFNTIHAKATSAQYADVAERYSADADYPVGTVLVFGGDQEVTMSSLSHSSAVAGTVSENPSYIMNAGLKSTHVAMVALLGRVPVRVVGDIQKGDLLVASDNPGVATKLSSDLYQPGCVIGKALSSHAGSKEGVIEAVVGRL